MQMTTFTIILLFFLPHDAGTSLEDDDLNIWKRDLEKKSEQQVLLWIPLEKDDGNVHETRMESSGL